MKINEDYLEEYLITDFDKKNGTDKLTRRVAKVIKKHQKKNGNKNPKITVKQIEKAVYEEIMKAEKNNSKSGIILGILNLALSPIGFINAKETEDPTHAVMGSMNLVVGTMDLILGIKNSKELKNSKRDYFYQIEIFSKKSGNMEKDIEDILFVKTQCDKNPKDVIIKALSIKNINAYKEALEIFENYK